MIQEFFVTLGKIETMDLEFLREKVKERAIMLFEKFENTSQVTPARDCAILCAEEMIRESNFTENKRRKMFWEMVLLELQTYSNYDLE